MTTKQKTVEHTFDERGRPLWFGRGQLWQVQNDDVAVGYTRVSREFEDWYEARRAKGEAV